MKGVIDHIDVRAVVDSDEWVLLDSFEFFGIKVPMGFRTDFASIPRLIKFWLNPVGKVRPAALVHDFLYNKRGILGKGDIDPQYTPHQVYGLLRGKLGEKHLNEVSFNSWKEEIRLTQKGSDLILLRIMEHINYSWIKRKAVYGGVRLGGWVFWNKKE